MKAYPRDGVPRALQNLVDRLAVRGITLVEHGLARVALRHLELRGVDAPLRVAFAHVEHLADLVNLGLLHQAVRARASPKKLDASDQASK